MECCHCVHQGCQCGHFHNLKSLCRCSTNEIYKYRSKISGPLLDRIDIHIEIPAAKYQELTSTLPAENSVQIKERINKARSIQKERFFAEVGSASGEKNGSIICNALMSHKTSAEVLCIGQRRRRIIKDGDD